MINILQLIVHFIEKDDQDRKSVYEILEYHHVHIIDDRNFKAALMQMNYHFMNI